MPIKFRSTRDAHIVTYRGREHLFRDLRDAVQYVYYLKFIALVAGQPIGVHNDTLYPVNSLLPPVVEKVVKYYDLGDETW